MSVTEASRHERTSWRDTAILGLAIAVLTVSAALIMFSAFMSYDDEGYVLLSLRNFIAHGGLYRDVYSQYGPFPFVLYYALDGLGLSLTHTVGRILALGAWTGAALSCAAIVGFVTRDLILRIAVLAAAFAYLWVMASEPSHPGGMIVLLTTAMAALGYYFIRHDRLRSWAILSGAGAMILVLTKINIGVFAAFSAGAWLLLHHRDTTVRRWAPVLLVVLSIALPFGLMRPLLATPWVQTYAFTFACSAVAVIIVSSTGASGRADWRTVGPLVSTALLVGAVVLAVVFLRGTTARELVQGVLLGPAKHPTAFSLNYPWPPGAMANAIISLALCTGAVVLRRRGSSAVDIAVAILRLIAGIGLALGIAQYPNHDPANFVFGLALPYIWPFVWRLPAESSEATSARSWVALVLLGQCLHPFPVPGSQTAWGSVLLIPVAAVGGWDAATWLAARGTAGWMNAKSVLVGTRVILIAFGAVMMWKFATVAGRYRSGQFLAQPGAEMIRLPDVSAALYRVLTINAKAHADMLFSEPGMFSLNIWTALPTPTHANVTHWFSLLDDSRQQAIARALEAHPRACIVVDRGHVDFLNKLGYAPRGVLHDYIAEKFEPAFVVDRFEFRVHRGRRIEPFLVADLLTRTKAAGAENSPGESTLLKLGTLLSTPRPIASVEIYEGGAPTKLHEGNARVEIAPANARGEPIGPAKAQPWPFRLTGPSVLFIYFNDQRSSRSPAVGTLILRDETGEEEALALLRP